MLSVELIGDKQTNTLEILSTGLLGGTDAFIHMGNRWEPAKVKRIIIIWVSWSLQYLKTWWVVNIKSI